MPFEELSCEYPKINVNFKQNKTNQNQRGEKLRELRRSKVVCSVRRHPLCLRDSYMLNSEIHSGNIITSMLISIHTLNDDNIILNVTLCATFWIVKPILPMTKLKL